MNYTPLEIFLDAKNSIILLNPTEDRIIVKAVHKMETGPADAGSFLLTNEQAERFAVALLNRVGRTSVLKSKHVLGDQDHPGEAKPIARKRVAPSARSLDAPKRSLIDVLSEGS